MNGRFAGAGITALLGAALLAGCGTGPPPGPPSGAQNAPPATTAPPAAQGGWASVPSTPPPSAAPAPGPACQAANNRWTTGIGGVRNVDAQTDAEGLQGLVASPYDETAWISPSPGADVSGIAGAALASSSRAGADPIPCGDTARFYPTAMHDYHEAAAATLAGDYHGAWYLLRQGVDAMAWLESESIGIGYITGPVGDYGAP